MNRWRRILLSAWRHYFAMLFALQLVYYFPLFYCLLAREGLHGYAFGVMRFFARSLLFLAGVRYRVQCVPEARPFLEKGSPACIYCANHASYLDVPLSYCFIRRFFIQMGKGELARWPLFGLFFKKMNISFDRASAVDAHRAFQRAKEELDKGNCLMIFPEGGIPKENIPHLHPFKNGPFRLAIEKQVPIVPVTFPDNWKILSYDEPAREQGGPGTARVLVHGPVTTAGMTRKDLLLLRNRVQQIIGAPLEEAAHATRS